MARIQVKVRSDIGDPGTHMVYGKLEPGQKLEIEEEHFGAGLFERPNAKFLSVHEEKDKARSIEEGRKVGDFEPPQKKSEEVKDNA